MSNTKVKSLLPLLIGVLILMVLFPLISFARTRGRGVIGVQTNDEENSYRPPIRGYLAPGPVATPTTTPPAPSSTALPHYHHHPYPYWGSYYYGYPYTDAIVLNALANEAANRNCYKEVRVQTQGYGMRTLCLTRSEYISRLKKELNLERARYNESIKAGQVVAARRSKQRAERLNTELNVEIGN